MLRRSAAWLVVSAAALIPSAFAHEHHDEPAGMPYENNFVEDGPIDAILATHIAIQVFCWGLLFPAGMVLGLAKSRLHVPLQSLGVVLVFVANRLAHHHGGRKFHTTAHSKFAKYVFWYMILQAACGVFLKLHVLEGSKTRRAVQRTHSIAGRLFPIVGWTQMIFGGIAALGFCFGEHVGQCLAHFIMGSSFIAYGVFLLLMARFGASFLATRNTSQDFLDSAIICAWGAVNSVTEHRPLFSPFSHKDAQHTSMGVLWVFGGAVGMLLGRKGKRNVIPGVIIVMTGYAMSAHEQSLEFSTTVHKVFGVVLMAAGAARVVEICFVIPDTSSATLQPAADTLRTAEQARPEAHLRDASDSSEGVEEEERIAAPVKPFQHLPPFLLVLAGLTFLSATEEQVAWIAGSNVDSTTYANILFSGAFAIYFVSCGLVEMYLRARMARHSAEKTRWFWNAWSRQEDGLGQAGRMSAPYERVVEGDARRAPATHAASSTVVDGESSDSFELRERARMFDVGEDEEDDGGDAYWDDDHEKPRPVRT